MQKEEGIVKIPSHHSVDETVEKLKAILKSKGVTLFALVDHSGEAEKVGLKMPPTKLLIFGNPKGGTPRDAGGAERSHRPATENSGCGRSAGQGVDLVQQPGISERATRFAGASSAEYRRRAGAGGCRRQSSSAEWLALRRSPRRGQVLSSHVSESGQSPAVPDGFSSAHAQDRLRKARCGMTTEKVPRFDIAALKRLAGGAFRPRRGVPSRRTRRDPRHRSPGGCWRKSREQKITASSFSARARRSKASATVPPSTIMASANTWWRLR